MEPSANPGRYGEELALWLAAGLAECGWEVRKPVCEDWGWLVWAANNGVNVAFECGNEDGSSTRWMIAPVVRQGLLKRILGMTKADLTAEKADADIERLLKADGTVTWMGREHGYSPPS